MFWMELPSCVDVLTLCGLSTEDALHQDVLAENDSPTVRSSAQRRLVFPGNTAQSHLLTESLYPDGLAKHETVDFPQAVDFACPLGIRTLIFYVFRYQNTSHTDCSTQQYSLG